MAEQVSGALRSIQVRYSKAHATPHYPPSRSLNLRKS
jgi:hypothetical protein